MSIDSNVDTSGKVTEEEFCASIVNRGNEKVDDGSVDLSEEDEEQEEPVSHREMVMAMNILRKGVHQYAESFDEHYKYEQFINKLLLNTTHQVTLDKYFHNIDP